MSPRPSNPLTYEYILLGILEKQPMHGYDLHKEVAALQGISLIWSVKQSQLYALLDKLETQGLLNSTLVPGEAHPQRKEFKLSSAGHDALHTWMQTPVSHTRDMRQEFLARLYFAKRTGKAPALHLIRAQAEVCQGWLVSLQHQADELEDDLTFEQWIFEFRISQVQAVMNWLDRCERKLII
jgi:PadR family transcriptional regulator, regulatory protein AphA